MNKVEFWLMNNPFRAVSQRFEVKYLRKISDLKKGGRVLEIGCGQGVGAKLIDHYFSPSKIQAIDLDKNMIARAKNRIKKGYIHFAVGDASKLNFKNESFDAVFDFGIIHHIPNWEDCLKELYRVLKPGGQLIAEDGSIESFETGFGKILRKVLVHPYEKMYRRDDFFKKLEETGFKIIQKYENRYWFSFVAKK